MNANQVKEISSMYMCGQNKFSNKLWGMALAKMVLRNNLYMLFKCSHGFYCFINIICRKRIVQKPAFKS